MDRVYVVLLDDEASVGLCVKRTIEHFAAKESALPANLDFIHFQNRDDFDEWLSVPENRQAVGFFIIDKNLDIKESGYVIETENGILAFDNARRRFGDDLLGVDFVIFSGDHQLTEGTNLKDYFDPKTNIKFLLKPSSETDELRVYYDLLKIMLTSDQFWEAVERINGEPFDSTSIKLL